MSILPASATQEGYLTAANQSVGGVKTFTASPQVPAPLLPGDAVNKAYMDSSEVQLPQLLDPNASPAFLSL